MQMMFVQPGGAGCAVSLHCPFVLHVPQGPHNLCVNLWDFSIQEGLESLLIWSQFSYKPPNFPETGKAREQQVLQEVTFLLYSEITKIISSSITFVVCLMFQVPFKGVNSCFVSNFMIYVRKGNYFCLIISGICVILVELFQVKIMVSKQNI